METPSNKRKFFVALDETSPTSVKRILEQYGYSFSPNFSFVSLLKEFSSLRNRILQNPAFCSSSIEGVILPLDSAYEEINGKSVPAFLLEKDISSYLKIDDGVSKDEHGLKVPSFSKDELKMRLAFAHLKQFKGIKIRSFIYSSDSSLIKAAVKKTQNVAREALKSGLTPIIELEVDTHIADRAKAEKRLLEELLKKNGRIAKKGEVIYRFSYPLLDRFYAPLSEEDGIIELLAKSGDLSKEEIETKIKGNPELVPAFSRLFISSLKANMDEKEFSEALEKAISYYSNI